jgi:DNA-binding NtrC family response regulator
MATEPGIDLRSYPVLVVDDEQDNLDTFRFNFRKLFDLRTAGSADEALEVLEQTDVAVVVTDQRMPGVTGIELLRRVEQVRPEAVRIILTAYTDVNVLLEAVNMGQIYRYITKPWDSREVKAVLTQAVERFHLRRENRRMAEQLRQYAGFLDYQSHSAFDFGNIVGESGALQEVLKRVEQVAGTSSTVLLRGETGTGKEMVARAIHLNSERADHPFVGVNCAALPTELLESELFGHEKGAFTGAIAQRKGRFELADGGTLFLDEIGDLPMEVQVKLLRVLQEREFERVGGSAGIRVDVRLISATNSQLEVLVEQGRFRQDLYYRLNVFPIQLPPLRERGQDVLVLAEHFLDKFARQNRREPQALADDARAALLSYGWPGNVRELQNVMERGAIVTSGTLIPAAALDLHRQPQAQPAAGVVAPADSGGLRARLEQEERDSIVRAIEDSGGNIAAAARALGVNRSTLYFRIKKLGLDHMLPNRLLDTRGEKEE